MNFYFTDLQGQQQKTMYLSFFGKFGIFSDDQIDKWSIITHDRLLSMGFLYKQGIGKSEYVLDRVRTSGVDNLDTDRFVFDSNRSTIQDFKFRLPAKHCSSIYDIKKYIEHCKYFDR